MGRKSADRLAEKLFAPSYAPAGSKYRGPKSAWDQLSKKDEAKLDSFTERYLGSMENRTPRERVGYITGRLEERGIQSFESQSGGDPITNSLNNDGAKMTFPRGGSFYTVFNDTMVVAVKFGKKKMHNGINVGGAHLDSPRLLARENPIMENYGIAYMRLGPVGGIQPEDWCNTPLDLHIHGVRDKRNKKGRKIDDVILRDIVISQESLHMGEMKSPDKDQLIAVLGTKPYDDGSFNSRSRVKLETLSKLHKLTGFTEADLLSSEIVGVPNRKPFLGDLDGSTICGYGHDNWACSFGLLEGFVDNNSNEHMSIAIWYDGEEIGDTGRGSLSHQYLSQIVLPAVSDMEGKELGHQFEGLRNGWSLFLDVSEPIHEFDDRDHDKLDSPYLARGFVLQRSSGDEAHYNAYQSSPEILEAMRVLFGEKKVAYQFGAMGNPEERAPGANDSFHADFYGEGIDGGIPILGMHRMTEVISSVDLWNMKKAVSGVFGVKNYKDYLPS